VAVTGTNGKSTTTRMVAQIFRQQGKTVGFTSTSGIYVDDEMIWAGDASGPQSARRLFANPCLDVAVLETARGGLLREGLACDSVDVGAVLNVTADHLGLSGVHTLEDLADVKSIVTESVSRDGVSVINADDPACARVARHARGRLCYFSMHGGQGISADLRAHVEAGGMAVVCETWPGRQEIVLHDEGRRIPLMPVQDIPATLNGAAHFNVENALAAAAIAYAMKVDVRTIRAGLSSFATTFERNPGRMNVFDGHGFRVILDYAHNPAALRALLEVSGRLRNGYGRVIGTVSVPGDRRDEDIMEMGRIAASGFDFLVFRENPDRRGRKPGEINALLEKGAMSAGFARDRIVSVYPEEEAIDICLREAKQGDLVLLMPSKVADSWKRVLSYRPQAPAARPASASPFDLAAGAVFHA
jgi:cyanophycin synthetase